MGEEGGEWEGATLAGGREEGGHPGGREVCGREIQVGSGREEGEGEGFGAIRALLLAFFVSSVRSFAFVVSCFLCRLRLRDGRGAWNPVVYAGYWICARASNEQRAA